MYFMKGNDLLSNPYAISGLVFTVTKVNVPSFYRVLRKNVV